MGSTPPAALEPQWYFLSTSTWSSTWRVAGSLMAHPWLRAGSSVACEGHSRATACGVSIWRKEICTPEAWRGFKCNARRMA
ncbi:hypothetical protein HanRHA438_Chr04g0164051 [Helianthus annuus]|nr:hypothetical protein HanIR_Chr04g0165821 [Helianthus annuus]KAJ0925824.1 hypothetical protein HanRHA438_Chr04g0164051 [Helianthus annuus]